MEKKTPLAFTPIEASLNSRKGKPEENKFIHIERDEESIKFQEFFRKIEVDISYSFKEQLFQATIKNEKNIKFQPQKSEFTAKSLDVLIRFIELEARTPDFSNFVGFKNRNKILKNIASNNDEIIEVFNL